MRTLSKKSFGPNIREKIQFSSFFILLQSKCQVYRRALTVLINTVNSADRTRRAMAK